MRVSLSSMPSQNPTKVVNFPRLDGGLNLWELDYRLDLSESPDMKNLWWQDGVLQCRDGQEYLIEPAELGEGHTCAQSLFWDYAFLHIGPALYYMDPEAEKPILKELVFGIPENRGTFFRYGDYLFYKNRGSFIRIAYNPNQVSNPFVASSMTSLAYVPVTLMNADPEFGSGDAYQPENRLTAAKTVYYNAKTTPVYAVRTIDTGSALDFSAALDDENYDPEHLVGVGTVLVNDSVITDTMYNFDKGTKVLTFITEPGNGARVAVELLIGVVTYRLPTKAVTSVDNVVVDGVSLTPGVDYAIDLAEGKIVFVTPPPVTNPPTNNTVEITYIKEDEDSKEALASIMDCKYAVVYGAGNDLSILFGGCKAQPNAVFWNSNDNVSMNPGYWPMSYYNLCGDTEDTVTGFGRQYSYLMVFKKRSLGKLNYTVATLDGRDSISYTYESVNTKIGCDLPWTIQLIENNLTFCNTSGGVFRVQDTSYANENNVVNISLNVNGNDARPGLLAAVKAADPDRVCSFDDDNRYWVCAGGEAYAWDYLLSGYSKPSWFYFTNIRAVAFLRENGKSYHLNDTGGITVFQRDFLDYGEAIEKVYQFPPQFFDTYDRLKDIQRVIFTVRSDTDSIAKIQYRSDYERRDDLTPIRVFAWRVAPRNLLWRCLTPANFAHVAIRKPGCRHVRHFSMRLENSEPGQDLAILSAQIFFRFLGRDR